MPIKGLPSGPSTLPAIVAPHIGDAHKKAKLREIRSLCADRMTVTPAAFDQNLRFEPHRANA
jgi:hypothetical protein